MWSALSTWEIPSKETIGEVQIIFSVVVFGVSFVLARFAMIDNKIGPITFTACRFLVSTTLLYIFRPCAQKMIHSEVEKSAVNIHNNDTTLNLKSDTMQLWLWGIICGTSNLTASMLLQIGLVTVTAGKARFITGMYVVFIPVVEYFLPGYGVHLTWKSWVAAIVCIVGLYLISGCAEQEVCFGGGGAVQSGELLILGGMVCWIVNIMIGDIGAKNLDVFSFTLVDFFVCTVAALLLSFYFEAESWVYPFTAITSSGLTILAIGLTEALAFPMSTMGQMYVAPARASLLMSLESLTCALGGYLFLHEYLTGVELCGCLLMFIATLVSTSSQSSANEEEGGSEDGSEYEEDSVASDQHSPLYASEMRKSPLKTSGGKGGISKFFFGSFTFSGRHKHGTQKTSEETAILAGDALKNSSSFGSLEMLPVSTHDVVIRGHRSSPSREHTDRLTYAPHSDHNNRHHHASSSRSRQNSAISTMSSGMVNTPHNYGSVMSAGISGVVHNVSHTHHVHTAGDVGHSAVDGAV